MLKHSRLRTSTKIKQTDYVVYIHIYILRIERERELDEASNFNQLMVDVSLDARNKLNRPRPDIQVSHRIGTIDQ